MKIIMKKFQTMNQKMFMSLFKLLKKNRRDCFKGTKMDNWNKEVSQIVKRDSTWLNKAQVGMAVEMKNSMSWVEIRVPNLTTRMGHAGERRILLLIKVSNNFKKYKQKVYVSNIHWSTEATGRNTLVEDKYKNMHVANGSKQYRILTKRSLRKHLRNCKMMKRHIDFNSAPVCTPISSK